MIDQRLFTYIEQELKRGVPDISVKRALREAGWPEDAIKQAFVIIQSRAEPPRPEVEVPEDQIVRTGRIRKPKKAGRKLPWGAILVVTVIIAALAGAWYYFFVLPEQKEAANIQRILDTGGGQGGGPEDSSTKPPAAQGDLLNIIPEGQTDSAQSGPNQDTLKESGDVVAGQSDTEADGVADPGDAQDPAVGRDTQRRADLDRLASAQKLWFGERGSYYTCGLSGGDCGGKAYGFPSEIGIYLAQIPQDPLIDPAKKAVCGTDYAYCGLNNAPYPNFFCYYAKLEGGGYYVVSHGGGVNRSTVPKVFEDCTVVN